MKDTHHEKIMISAENQVEFSIAHHILQSLKSIENKHDADIYRDMIKSLLPEYQSVSLSVTKESNKQEKNINQFI
jgi:hypothetical protein